MSLPLYTQLMVHHATALRAAVTARVRGNGGGEEGLSTLELVIIALGLIAVATLLVTAITAAVNRRTDQIQ